MLQQIDNIIYNVVYRKMLSPELFDDFNKIIERLNDDNNKNEDFRKKAIELNQFFKKCGINPLNIYLKPNNLISEKISQITNTDIFKNNIQLTQEDVSNLSYKTIISYIIQNCRTDIDKDKLYDIKSIDDDKMTTFIGTFNDMIEEKTLISILKFIYFNNFTLYYSKLFDDKFSQLNVPIDIYKALVDNKDVQDNINSNHYKEIYAKLLTLLKKDDDKEFIEYFRKNISEIDINEGIKDIFLKKEITVDKDIFKTDKLTVSKFLENVQNLNDVITYEQFKKWNDSLSETLVSIDTNTEELKTNIENIKKSLNTDEASVVIDKDEQTKKETRMSISCKKIFNLFNTPSAIKTLNGIDKSSGDNSTVGGNIIKELQELFDNNLPDLEIHISKDNSFFESFKLLVSDENIEIFTFFKNLSSKINGSNIFNVYTTILNYISNNKPYPALSVFYTLMYFIGNIKVESVLYYRGNDVCLFEGKFKRKSQKRQMRKQKSNQNDTEDLIDKAYKYIEKKEGTDTTLTDFAISLYNTVNSQDNISDQDKAADTSGTDVSVDTTLDTTKKDIEQAAQAVKAVENN